MDQTLYEIVGGIETPFIDNIIKTECLDIIHVFLVDMDLSVIFFMNLWWRENIFLFMWR